MLAQSKQTMQQSLIDKLKLQTITIIGNVNKMKMQLTQQLTIYISIAYKNKQQNINIAEKSYMKHIIQTTCFVKNWKLRNLIYKNVEHFTIYSFHYFII